MIRVIERLVEQQQAKKEAKKRHENAIYMRKLYKNVEEARRFMAAYKTN